MSRFDITHVRIDPQTYGQTVLGEYVADATTTLEALDEARRELGEQVRPSTDYLRAHRRA